jgi:hypothetical protein
VASPLGLPLAVVSVENHRIGRESERGERSIK